MKTLLVIMIYSISLGGSLMVINPATAINDAGNTIHLDQSRQFPETRWADADHYLRVHVPRNSAAMSALSFQVPGNLRFDANQVAVFDIKGQKILATVSEGINSSVYPAVKTIQLDFSTPIASGNQIDLQIRNVKKISVSRPSTYSISAKLIDGDQFSYIGEAYFRSY